MSNEINEKDIQLWDELSKLLKKTKADEMALRKKICKTFTYHDRKADKIIGNFHCKAKETINTKIDDQYDVLEDRDGMPPELQDCFKLKVEFSKSAYNKLSDEMKKEADAYLTEYPGAPTLEAKRCEK